MIFDLGFQIAGAILLVYGIAIRKRKEIIESTVRPPFITRGKVPKIIKEKWIETYLCRFGISFTLIGYAFSIFNFTITESIYCEIIGILILNVILIVASLVMCEDFAEKQYTSLDPMMFENYAKENGLIMMIENEKNFH